MNVILFGPFEGADMTRTINGYRGAQSREEFVGCVQQWLDDSPNVSIEHVAPLVVEHYVLLLIFYRSS